MQPDLHDKPSSPGLPPVTPPTAGMFLRLFLIPALIVAGLVALLVLFNWAGKYLAGWGGGRTAAEYLKSLDDDNKDIRWRAASDLVPVLLRDDKLAADAEFALQLVVRLERARSEIVPAEKSFLARLPTLMEKRNEKQLKAELERLDPDRGYILYLESCLGNFMVPVGAPLLEKMAVEEPEMEPRTLAARRLRAVWSLANLGENLKRFDNLAAEHKDAVLEALHEAENGEQGSLAKKTAEYLKRRRETKADSFGVEETLRKCADSRDIALREMAAFAMNFWTGNAAEEARIEEILVRLANDSGQGEDELARVLEDAPGETRAVTKIPGYRVQINATIALARRGSPKVELGLLEEMLNPAVLRQRFVLVNRDESHAESADEGLIASTEINALKAVAELHRRRPERDLSGLRPLIDRLAGDSNPAMQAEARQTKLALDKKD
jgi:hypothetical protein